jgi:hypothetical protein
MGRGHLLDHFGYYLWRTLKHKVFSLVAGKREICE